MASATPKPALEPPPGITPNFINPSSEGHITIIVNAVLLALTTPIFLVRMYTRCFVNRRVWWDDYTMVIAWVGLIGFAAILIEAVKYGSGVDMWNVTRAHGARFRKLITHSEVVARISFFFTKFSILLLFLRVFRPLPVRKDKMFYAIWFVIWFNLLYCVALVLAVTLQCVGKKRNPVDACINTFAISTSASTINVSTDIMMLVIPLIEVWNLHMSRRRKLGLSFVFAVGFLALASSVARLGWQLHFWNNSNRTARLPKAALLAISEQAIGIIVGCLPVLPALFRHISRKRSQSRSSGSGSERWKMGSGTFGSRRSPRPMNGGSKDSYPLSRKYKELDDLESQHKPATQISATTRSPEDISIETPVLDTTAERLRGSSDTGVLVSRCIQVESRPRVMEGKHTLPQPAHVRL